jgi:cyanobactin cluster PatC/TenC/TruC protein
MTGKAAPKSTSKGTSKRTSRGGSKGASKESTPPEDFQPKTDSEAAKHAMQVAESAKTGGGPVPVTSVHPLGTGLVDYGMWVEMFSHAGPVEADQPYRRGRIWS